MFFSLLSAVRIDVVFCQIADVFIVESVVAPRRDDIAGVIDGPSSTRERGI